jgi:coupling of ubiquitin conjugation to ER degradation protein 1
MAQEQTINLPQLLLVLFIGGLAVRYFFFSGPATPSPAAPSASNVRAREADVERIQQMFPQVPRRNIMWDLQRNGGNLAATTERILSGRGLETVSLPVRGVKDEDREFMLILLQPPPTFQPPLPAAAPLSSTTGSNAASKSAKPQSPPDLITRYNLASKLAIANAEAEASEGTSPGGTKQAWSQNKVERQTLMQRRREEMILAARKKMEAKIAAEAQQNAVS